MNSRELWIPFLEQLFTISKFQLLCMFQWSPDKSSIFGSSAEDGVLNIWDHNKVCQLNQKPLLLLFHFPLFFSCNKLFFLIKGLFVCLQVGERSGPASKFAPGLLFRHSVHRYIYLILINGFPFYRNKKIDKNWNKIILCYDWRDKVVDFHWNSHDPWTIVSVSDDGESTGGGGTLQVCIYITYLLLF